MYYLLFIFIMMMLSRLMFMFPILGIIIYIVLIYVMYSSMKKRRDAMYKQYNASNAGYYSQSQNTSSNSSFKKRDDVIDVEYSEEDVKI